jgi:DNA-binding transcriptional ArsR family regulator
MDEQLTKEVYLLHEQVCHALGDPIRLLIFYALSQSPHYVNDLADELNLPQPTVSRHLKILRERSLVTAKRDGPAVLYSLADDRVIAALDLLRGVLRDRIFEQAQFAQAPIRKSEAPSETELLSE